MLKELASYIAELATEAKGTEVIKIGDDTYIDGRRLLPDYASNKRLNSLNATVDFLRTTCQGEDFTYPIIVSVTHGYIECYSSLDKYKRRDEILEVKPVVPNINFDCFMYLEQFIIQLQTCFMDTVNKQRLLELVSSFVESEKVEVSDTGISQKVVVEKGSSVKTKDAIVINPFVRLAAYRTYQEVEQPETVYLLRVKENNQIALFEADGGQWKVSAQANISKYLREKLADLIEQDKVVIVG